MQNTETDKTVIRLLDYFHKPQQSHHTFVSWIRVMGAIYATTCIGTNISQVIYLWPKTFGFWSLDLIGLCIILVNSISVIAAIVLLFTCLLALKCKRVELMLAWPSAMIAIMNLLKMFLAIFIFAIGDAIHRLGSDILNYSSTRSALFSVLFSMMERTFLPFAVLVIYFYFERYKKNVYNQTS